MKLHQRLDVDAAGLWQELAAANEQLEWSFPEYFIPDDSPLEKDETTEQRAAKMRASGIRELRKACPGEVMTRDAIRNRLVEHYAPFANQLAASRAKKNNMVDPGDYQQESLIGLMGAVDAYDLNNSKGASFTTFASLRVRGAIVEAERANDWVNHKVRRASESPKGTPLPKMGKWADGFGEMTPDQREHVVCACERMAGLLDETDPSTAHCLRLLIETEFNLEEVAQRQRTSVNQVRANLRTAVDRCQKPDDRFDDQRERKAAPVREGRYLMFPEVDGENFSQAA